MALFSGAQAQAPVEPPSRIAAITLAGNYRTRGEIVRLYLGLEPGMVYDSTVAETAKQRLEKTGLFHKVALLTVEKADGIHVFVVLTEKTYLSLTDISGEIHSRRYGKTSAPLLKSWSLSLGIKYDNFRGRMETLRLFTRFWEWRSLYLSWYKPFVPSDWYLSVGAGYSTGPEETRARLTRSVSASLTTGRKWPTEGLQTSLSTVPRYTVSLYKGNSDSAVFIDETRPFLYPETAPVTTEPPPADSFYSTDRVWSWKGPVAPDSIRYQYWGGDSLWEADRTTEEFFEIFTCLSAVLDRTDNRYPNQRGYLLWGRLGYNLPLQLSNKNAAREFVQLDLEGRLYHPVLFRGDSWAHRLRLTIRDSDGGVSHLVTAGSESSLRGYASASIGKRVRANNRLLFTTEYRFPLIKTPKLPVPTAAGLYTPLNSLYYRFDGALFADFALLWHNWRDNPFRKSGINSEIGSGMGVGIRMLAPQMKRCVCFDMVPVVWDSRDGRLRSFYSLAKDRGYKPVLPWHLYVDMTF